MNTGSRIKPGQAIFRMVFIVGVIIFLTSLSYSSDLLPLPETPKKPVTDVYHGVKVTEDYRWLEDFDDPVVRQWSDQQNRHARAVLDGIQFREAIYERLEAHIRALHKQVENITQLIAYYNYVEAMLGHINEVLQRIYELILMRSNSIYSESDRSLINSEIHQSYEDILYVFKNAEFNRKPVFKYLCEDECFAARFKQEEYYKLENVDSILSFIITQRAFYGAKINRIEKRRKAEMIERENAEDFQSTILDVDYGSEITLLKQNQLLFLINILLLN